MIANHIKNFLDAVSGYEPPKYLSAGQEDSVIEVDNITSQAAHYYEKIRYAVDYKDEDALQRSAIERIIKRRITFSVDESNIAKELIMELIQAGYLPNGKVSQDSISIVQSVIDKYVIFMDLVRDIEEAGIKNAIYDSAIVSMCACEVEDILFPSVIKEAAADAMYSYIKDSVNIKDAEIHPFALNMQIYIATHRSLFKSDDARLFYNMWIINYPEWLHINTNDASRERLREMSAQYLSIKEDFRSHLKHPIQTKLIPKLKNHVIYFSAIFGVIGKFGKDSQRIFSNYDALSEEVRSFISQKYIDEKKRVGKMAWRAVFYIFITKIILALLIELPYDLFVAHSAKFLALGVNIVFHPLLLMTITRSVVSLGEDNTERIISGVNDIVYGAEKKKISLNISEKNNILLYVAFVLYGFLFVISFGFILLALKLAGFNWIGMMFFVFFLTLVSFFGLRIRHIAKMWNVRVKNAGFFAFIWDVFTLPIVSLGRWLMQKFAAINIFVFIMDFIIETPFKAFLKISDSFISFVKEKKEEIV